MRAIERQQSCFEARHQRLPIDTGADRHRDSAMLPMNGRALSQFERRQTDGREHQRTRRGGSGDGVFGRGRLGCSGARAIVGTRCFKPRSVRESSDQLHWLHFDFSPLPTVLLAELSDCSLGDFHVPFD